MHLLKQSLLASLAMSTLAIADGFWCEVGWPSNAGRYGPPPGWKTEGDPIPVGWNWGDVLPGDPNYHSKREAARDFGLSHTRDSTSRMWLDLAEVNIPGLNHTEIGIDTTSAGVALNGTGDLGKRDAVGTCCRWTWDCQTWWKSGHWDLHSYPSENFKKSSCFMLVYERSCARPREGEMLGMAWPPACSN